MWEMLVLKFASFGLESAAEIFDGKAAREPDQDKALNLRNIANLLRSAKQALIDYLS